MEKSNDFLGSEKINKLLLRLALPAVMAQIVNMLYNVVDRIYIGHIPQTGTLALTGLGICFPIIMLISAFTMLVGMGGAPRASIFMGRGDKQSAEKILGNCFTVLLVEAALLMAVFYFWMEPILLIFGASENTLAYAKDYLSVYLLGTAFVQISMGLNAFITAQGFSKISMLSVVIGAAVNILLDPLFIFVFDMGVSGAALATVFSQAVSAVWVLSFLSGHKTVLHLRFKNMRLQAACILPCLALGLSPFIMNSTESILFVCFNASLLKYGGDIAVGAMTILSSVMQLVMLPLAGLTQGAQPIVSYNLGAGNGKRVKDAFLALLKCCVFFSVLFWLLLMIFPKGFASLFSSDEVLIVFTEKVLRIYMSASFLLGVQLACQQTFVAIGNAKASVFLAVLRKIILLIPLIYILPWLYPQDPVTAVYMAEPVADTLAVTATASLFFVLFRKTLRVIGEKPAKEK